VAIVAPDTKADVERLAQDCVRAESELGAATIVLQAAAIDVRFTAAIVTVQDRDVAQEIHQRLLKRLKAQQDAEIVFTGKRIIAERTRTKLHERLCGILGVCRHCFTPLLSGQERSAGVCSLCAADDDEPPF